MEPFQQLLDRINQIWIESISPFLHLPLPRCPPSSSFCPIYADNDSNWLEHVIARHRVDPIPSKRRISFDPPDSVDSRPFDSNHSAIERNQYISGTIRSKRVKRASDDSNTSNRWLCFLLLAIFGWASRGCRACWIGNRAVLPSCFFPSLSLSLSLSLSPSLSLSSLKTDACFT